MCEAEKIHFTEEEMKDAINSSVKNGWEAGRKAGRRSVFAAQMRAILCVFVGVLIICIMKYLGWV